MSREYRQALAFGGFFICILPFALFAFGTTGMAQDANCAADTLARQQDTLAQFLQPDFALDSEQGIANLFRLGAAYQTLALDCGYVPNEAETALMLEHVLAFVSLDDLLAAQAVGDDVEGILLELASYVGDPLNGQLIYNGMEPVLGGAALGCAGCHENEAVAPLTAGTWTRIEERRLRQPEFAEYEHRQYLVESIVQPAVYIVPDYAAAMPGIYGNQLTAQQLADLVAYLDSQDQLLDGD